ncbi:MAG: hypothetical protein H8D87_06440 [Deltaproteobacteria bacterium]|nr:hypothetical protein [Candidatus Desulfobacula maris]
MDENKELREELTAFYREGHFVFVPFFRLPKKNGLFVPVYERVPMNKNDFYQVQGNFGMHHFGMMKLADAAGVQWSSDGVNVGRIDNRSNPNYCSFRVVAKIRTTEGLWQEMAASKHIDLDAKRGAIEVKHAEAWDYKDKFGGGKGPNGYEVKKPWPAKKDEYVLRFAERDINLLREYMDERCESGAQGRAIKNMMHIPSVFPADTKNKNLPGCKMDFFVVRYILNPSNPRVQEKQLESFQMAIAGIYGLPSTQRQSLPEPKDVTPKEAPKETPQKKLPFEKLLFQDKIKEIESLIKESGYKFYAEDVATQPIQNWTDEELISYHKHILEESKQ